MSDRLFKTYLTSSKSLRLLKVSGTHYTLDFQESIKLSVTHFLSSQMCERYYHVIINVGSPQSHQDHCRQPDLSLKAKM